MLFGAARANVLLRGKLNCLLRGWKKKKEKRNKKDHLICQRPWITGRKNCLLDLCPAQQWAFLRVLWHHLRQLRFSEFLIVALGEESSVQLSLLRQRKKKSGWCNRPSFLFFLFFFFMPQKGWDQEFWVLVSRLYPKDKNWWIQLIEFLSPYEFAHSKTKPPKFAFISLL